MVICFYSDSAGLAVDPADPADLANPADPADSAAVAVAVSVSELVPDSVDDLLSLALLAGTVLYSFDLGSFACLLLVCLFYFLVFFFLVSFFFDETVLAFLTFYFFLYLACPAVPRILYRPVKT